MYDELIKQLRVFCEGCKLWDGCKCCLKGECSEQKSLQAADAIEELSKDLERTNAKVKEYKIKWIPVAERLPKICKNVLVTDGIDVGMGWYDIYKRRDTGITDKYWCTPNCDVDSDHLKYWAEMPEPPEREVE